MFGGSPKLNPIRYMPQTDTERVLRAEIPPEYAGQRLDQALARLFPEFSRAQIQKWIKEGHVSVQQTREVSGAIAPAVEAVARNKVKGGEAVEIQVPVGPVQHWEAEEIALKVVYADPDLIVIEKPAGMVVHPAAGNFAGTMLNALLNYAPELGRLPRAGIVHRLDKETSGLLVVARNERARRSLIAQLKERTLTREYLAVVNGVVIAGGSVDAPIGRHYRERTRMAVTESGKPAVSHYRVKRKFRAHTLLEVKLESGRTHQIRVHMAHLGYPIVGDPVYGGRLALPKGATGHLVSILRGFKRQALHAAGLGLEHPKTAEYLHWESPLPLDMKELIDALVEDAREHGTHHA